ncbi:MAG: LysR family transcriptional regulator [Ilumatobacteraceae bacterium]|nr:LysR family transcriptional regulator [Ilumatobacteraceae bacterium]MCU1387355.1 LysR family transcriptional regulator [Ilumatobacteraceae bacterium]
MKSNGFSAWPPAQLMAPNIERLRLLHAVATHGTIAGAARANGYTPSAVSQQMSTLEREIGATLIERSNRGVVLTPAGRLLRDRTSVILDLLRSAVDDVSRDLGDAHPAPTTVRLAAFPTAITSIVLPAMARLAPSVRLQIVDLEPEHALADLVARAIDAAIVDRYDDQPATGRRSRVVDRDAGRDGDRPASARFDRATLLIEPIRLVHGPGRRPRSLLACADAPWVLGGVNSRLGRAIRTICAAAGFEPDVIVESDDHRVAFDVITATNAVTMLPSLALVDVPAPIAISRRVEIGHRRRVEFVTRSVPHADATLARVEAALRAAAGRLP